MSATPICEDDLQAYIDEALDPARGAEVEAWLEAHPEDARRVAAYRAHRDALHAALEPVAAERVPPRLDVANIGAARRRARTASWRAVAAAVLLVAAGAGGGWALRGWAAPAIEGVAALAREAADSYQVYAPDRIRPVEVRADDRAALVAWVSQRLSRPVPVPDLSASGFRFMGGRLVATAHGPAVMFMYDNDHGARLVMLSRVMAVEGDEPMLRRMQGGVAGFAWSRHGIGYSLVGPVPPDALHPLADEVRRQMDGQA